MSTCPPTNDDLNTASTAINIDSGVSKDSLIKAAIGKLKESKRSDDVSKSMPPVEGEAREEPIPRKPKSEHKMEVGGERIKDRERDREREKERLKARDRERGRDSDREREREDTERDREKVRDRTHRSKDKGKDSGWFMILGHLNLCVSYTF